MGSTPIFGLPYPELTDPADVPLHIRNHALGTEGVLDSFADQIAGATGSFVKLGDVTLAAAAANIDFTAIPALYSHLLIINSLRSQIAAAAEAVAVRFNGIVTNGYHFQRLRGSGAVASAVANASQVWVEIGPIAGASAWAGDYGGGLCLLPNYTGSGNLKQVVAFGGMYYTGNSYADMSIGMSSLTTAINRVTVLPQVGPLAPGSRSVLYGLV